MSNNQILSHSSSSSSIQERRVVKDRIHELVIDNSSSTQSLVNAYKLKSELKNIKSTGFNLNNTTNHNSSQSLPANAPSSSSSGPSLRNYTEQADDASDPYIKIKTLDPFVILPKKRFEHCQSAVITANANQSKLKLMQAPSPKVTKNRSPSPGRQKTDNGPTVHEKLYAQENYPLAYKLRYDENVHDIAGDFIDDPRRAIKLLKGTRATDLNIPGRTGDFKSEVQWRLLLRSETNDEQPSPSHYHKLQPLKPTYQLHAQGHQPNHQRHNS